MLQDVTLCLLQRVLDVDDLKQQVISNNIANTNTPGFTAQSVDFNQALAAIGQSLNHGDRPEQTRDVIAHAKAEIEAATDHNTLDQQMLMMNQTSIEYQTLIKGVQQKYSLFNIAINGGNQ
ncbi:flagellar basal body rod protein FlgB [Cysteiniphilum litorale]|uniref:flagellar basal body rod protein FlgB n=1 Tax=Cysteiniphilum litorale TaxID=2056700 RepID=UPI003F880756